MGLLDLVSLARARQGVRWSLSVGTRFGIEEVAAGLLDKGLAPSEYPRAPNAESCRGGDVSLRPGWVPAQRSMKEASWVLYLCFRALTSRAAGRAELGGELGGDTSTPPGQRLPNLERARQDGLVNWARKVPETLHVPGPEELPLSSFSLEGMQYWCQASRYFVCCFGGAGGSNSGPHKCFTREIHAPP